jgi:hypothetical protein
MKLSEEDFTAFIEALMLHYVMTEDGDIVVYDPGSSDCDHANFSLNGRQEFEIKMDTESRIVYARRLRRRLEALRVMKERGATPEDWIRSLKMVLEKIEKGERHGG